MRRVLICRWWEKNNKPFVALLAAGAALAMATLIDASSSTQVEQLGPLVVPRTGHAATVLADGRVLITGGRDGAGTIVATAEIFDPATETSTAVGALVTARVSHTATLLPNGRVLIAGGTSATGPLSSVEIFDPANPGAAFRVLSATMGAARAGHTATLLKDGTVLIAGGDVAGTAEIFDPTAETFSSTLLTMAAPRIGHTATLFSNDSVLLAGGNTDSMELFTPADQKFTLDSKVMSAVHTGQEAISLSDTRLFFFGGDALNTIEEFNPSADTLAVDGTMDAPASSTTLLANGKILVLQPDLAGLYEPDAVAPNPAFTAFDETSVPGSTALLRSGQSATELSGDKKILVAGGANAQSQISQSTALFNPARIWTDKDDYQPTDPVVLNGSGWKANEDVYLYAVDSETEQWTYGSTEAADAQGSFAVEPLFIVEMRHLGTLFNVSAVGAQSNMQADVEFTDAGISKVNVVGAQTPSPVVPGNGVSYGVTAANSVNVTFNGNNTTCSVSLSASGLPAGAAAAFSPSSFSSTGTQMNSLLTVSTTTGVAPGTYNFTVTATAGGNCQGSNASTGATLVVANPPAKYVVTSSDNNPAAGSAVTISAQLADSGGLPVPIAGKLVTWSKTGTGGSFSSATSTTNASGIATVSFTTGTTAGTVYMVTGTDNSSPTNFTGTSANITTKAGAASKLLLSGSTADLAAGATRQLTATIEDANNNVVTTGADSSLSVSFAKTAGTGTVTGLGSATASAGVATLTVTGNAPGSITITASATGSGGALAAGTGNPITFNVAAGAASKLALSGSTANLTAGTSRTLTATIQDSVGNTITTGADSTLGVTFAKTTGTGSVTGLGSVNASAGVATITVTGATAGSVTIGASGGSLAAGTGNPITFTVVANTTVDHFAFATISSPQTAGITFNITITAQDAGNNTVTGYSGNGFKVKLTSTGTLVGAPVTTPAFTNGVLNNQSVTITNTGNFTITATDNSGSTSAIGTSNSFQVNPGAAAKLALTGSTANLASGSARTLTATIQDTNGNTVATGADSTLSVTFGKTSGTGSVTGLGS